VGDAKRGAYLTWLAYYAGVMEPAWMSAFMKWEVRRGTAGWVKTDEVMELVNATLEKSPIFWARNSAPPTS
jgi:glutathione S-transferase